MNLSIVIPVYNSANILDNLLSQIKRNIKLNSISKFEVILVNDASKDQSWKKIVKLKKKFKFVKGINLDRNIGQHQAIFVGLKYCSGKKIITMDYDMQHPPSYLINIYNKLDEFDSCYTLYVKRKHKFWKKAVSYINNIFSSYLFDKPFKVYLSSFRGFNSKIRDKIILERKKVLFLDALILKYAKNICTIKVLHNKRYKGDSNYKISNLFRLWFDMIENFQFYPIRFGSLIGLLSFIIVKVLRGKSIKKNFKIIKLLR